MKMYRDSVSSTLNQPSTTRSGKQFSTQKSHRRMSIPDKEASTEKLGTLREKTFDNNSQKLDAQCYQDSVSKSNMPAQKGGPGPKQLEMPSLSRHQSARAKAAVDPIADLTKLEFLGLDNNYFEGNISSMAPRKKAQAVTIAEGSVALGPVAQEPVVQIIEKKKRALLTIVMILILLFLSRHALVVHSRNICENCSFRHLIDHEYSGGQAVANKLIGRALSSRLSRNAPVSLVLTSSTNIPVLEATSKILQALNAHNLSHSDADSSGVPLRWKHFLLDPECKTGPFAQQLMEIKDSSTHDSAAPPSGFVFSLNASLVDPFRFREFEALLDDGGADPCVPWHSIFIFSSHIGAEQLNAWTGQAITAQATRQLTGIPREAQKQHGWSDRLLQKITQQVPILN
jgi:hypothetical protein